MKTKLFFTNLMLGTLCLIGCNQNDPEEPHSSFYDISLHGIYYTIDKINKTATVVDTEEPYRDLMSEDGTSYICTIHNAKLDSIRIPATLAYNGDNYSVTSIGEDAFCLCTYTLSITIPNSVTSIGKYAFRGCSGLTSIEIPNSVTSIGDRAFSGCDGLTSVTIPNSVTSIGDGAFDGCNELPVIEDIRYADTYLIEAVNNRSKYTIKEGTRWIGSYAFCKQGRDYGSLFKTITIPNSVISIGTCAFGYCNSLTTINIPNSVTSIGNSAFSNCSGLTSVTIPNSVTSIECGAFRDCSSLTSVTIPNSVTSIERSVFSRCISLASVTIPNSVTSIGACAFEYCRVTSVTIPNSVTSIGYGAFAYCYSLTSVTIPNSVTSIGGEAFYYCPRLASVTIPNSVTSIGDDAFKECSNLPVINDIRYADTYLVEALAHEKRSYTIKEGTRWIGNDAFKYCGLKSVIIPNSVINIGNHAFSDCKQLSTITCAATKPPTCYEYSFNYNSDININLYVPATSLEAYKADKYWGKLDFILSID